MHLVTIVIVAGHMEVQIVAVMTAVTVGVFVVLLVQLLGPHHQLQVDLSSSIAQIQPLISTRKLRVVLRAMSSGLTMGGKSQGSVV